MKNPTTPTTNATKHTPGPWRTATEKELERHPNDQPDIVMGGIGFRLVPIDGGGMLSKQIKANARLMAQAPELLWIAERFMKCRNPAWRSGVKWTKAEVERSMKDLENYAILALRAAAQ